MLYIAENLKALRKGKEWTQEEMAEMIGVSPPKYKQMGTRGYFSRYYVFAGPCQFVQGQCGCHNWHGQNQ